MINHSNRFFKQVKLFDDSLEAVSRLNKKFGHNPVGLDGIEIFQKWSHECDAGDCTKRADGLWETQPESYGKKLRRFVFVWRIHPNYCCAGRPHYTYEEQKEFLEKSEKEKVLYTYDGFEFVWGWDTIRHPTHFVWGMRMGQTFFMLRKDGVTLVKTPVKKHFRDAITAGGWFNADS